jgi:hypothetical protein
VPATITATYYEKIFTNCSGLWAMLKDHRIHVNAAIPDLTDTAGLNDLFGGGEVSGSLVSCLHPIVSSCAGGCSCQVQSFAPPEADVVIWSAAAASAGRLRCGRSRQQVRTRWRGNGAKTDVVRALPTMRSG